MSSQYLPSKNDCFTYSVLPMNCHVGAIHGPILLLASMGHISLHTRGPLGLNCPGDRFPSDPLDL